MNLLTKEIINTATLVNGEIDHLEKWHLDDYFFKPNIQGEDTIYKVMTSDDLALIYLGEEVKYLVYVSELSNIGYLNDIMCFPGHDYTILLNLLTGKFLKFYTR